MEIPFDSVAWSRGSAIRTSIERAGRAGIRFDATDGDSRELIGDVELLDGAIEVDLAVGARRAFHGVVWRLQDAENYESFFVRPHQVGNPDSIQYTPVWNDSSAWQLYHGEGFWASVEFPLEQWFTIRVVFAGELAEIYVADLERPVLVSRQRRPPAPGRVGLLVGGEGLEVARFAVEPEARPRATSTVPDEPPVEGAIGAWSVSSPFPEDSFPDPAACTWTRLESEPSGLVNLARLHPIQERRNTVYARVTLRSELAQAKELTLGFSDRATVLLNGALLYRGDATYRSRDYRFLGSIGYWDTLVLPLRAGGNELVFAVAEDFGGWGVQARFADLAGIELVG